MRALSLSLLWSLLMGLYAPLAHAEWMEAPSVDDISK